MSLAIAPSSDKGGDALSPTGRPSHKGAKTFPQRLPGSMYNTSKPARSTCLPIFRAIESE